MVVTEHYMTRDDGVDLNRTYSDAGFYIIQNETGLEYSEAIDVVPMRYTYSESKNKLPTEEEDIDTLRAKNAEQAEALKILGVNVNE